MRALPGTPVGGLFPPRLPPAIGEGQPHMAEQTSQAANSPENHVDICRPAKSLAEEPGKVSQKGGLGG